MKFQIPNKQILVIALYTQYIICMQLPGKLPEGTKLFITE